MGLGEAMHALSERKMAKKGEREVPWATVGLEALVGRGMGRHGEKGMPRATVGVPDLLALVGRIR